LLSIPEKDRRITLKEIETRIIDIDVDEIRRKLLNLNAPKVKQENQINRIYDFSDKRLIKSKGYARIRTVQDELTNSTIHYITTKKLVSQEKFKVMDEHESEIKDEIAAEGIFHSLGLELIQSIKKYRESYKYKNTLIEIDINEPGFCPFPYIEIESADESELEEVLALLGYSLEDTTAKTIYEILESKKAIKVL
jgi:adenylate cyclase class 2